MKITNLSFVLFSFLFFSTPVQAVCPVCTMAVGAGLGISRWIGIDDSVTGVWVGGLILSSGLWLADWTKKRKWKIPYPEIISTLTMVLFVILPLYWSHMIGITNNTLLGMDKVLLGTAVGSFLFIAGVWFDKWLRSTNENKVYIYYQKVIIPVFLLLMASFVFYLVTN